MMVYGRELPSLSLPQLAVVLSVPVSIVAGLLSATHPALALGLFGAAFIGILIFTFVSIPTVVLSFASHVNLPGSFAFMGISAIGIFTIGTSLLCLLQIFLASGVNRELLHRIAPIVLFVLWSFAIGATHFPVSQIGMQSLAVFGGFMLLIVVTGQITIERPHLTKYVAYYPILIAVAVSYALQYVSIPLMLALSGAQQTSSLFAGQVWAGAILLTGGTLVLIAWGIAGIPIGVVMAPLTIAIVLWRATRNLLSPPTIRAP